MSRFSGALQLTNLDDFITPSQECIKPVKIDKTKSVTGAKIVIHEDGSYLHSDTTGYVEKLQKVEISLTDCLACSGCITSAEGVLVTQQSQEELLRVFSENKNLKTEGKLCDVKKIVVSLSIQPILSLAARYNLSPEETSQRLSGYFRKLGADVVVDMRVADDLALLENQEEFIERYGNKNDGKKLPMLASSCPGWVCYAEKTHGSYILPYISTTKSPQQIMGSLVKYHLPPNGSQVYHVTLMPCYDKKLEAAREDFFNQDTQCRDVDCVITSIELEQMLDTEGLSLNNVEPSPLDYPWGLPKSTLTANDGSGSGGYAHSIFKYAAKQLFNQEINQLEFKNLRNPDFREVILEENGQVVLRFAIANGFRNIQNLVQKLKRGKSVYDYVEIMACPSGCLNGGAQVRPKSELTNHQLTKQLEGMYECLDKDLPENNEVVRNLYNSWLQGKDSDKARAMLRTQYHAVEKNSVALNIKW